MQPEPRNEDLVTITEISKLVGKARPTVSNWVRRYDDFPKPAGRGPKGPLFRRTEVFAWIDGRGLTKKRAVAASKEEDASGAGPQARSTANWEEAIEDLRRLMSWDDLVSLALSVLAGQPLQAGPVRDLEALGSLERANAGLSVADRIVAADGLFAACLNHEKGALHPTPAPVASMMVDLLGHRASVYDPACGPGVLLGSTRKWDAPAALFGQEIQSLAAELARQYLGLLDATAQIEVGDTLREDRYPGKKFAGILASPPLALRLQPGAISEADPRWTFATPTSNADEAWLQNVLYHLEVGGRAVVQVSSAVLSDSGRMRRLRTAMVRSGNLRCVIQLPRGCVAGTAVETALVILEHPEAIPPTPRVLVVDPDLPPLDEREWGSSEMAVIIDTVRRWLDEPDHAGALSVGFRVVHLEELAARKFDLTPRRLIRTVPVETPSLDQVRTSLEIATTVTSEAGCQLRHQLQHLLEAAPTKVVDLPRVRLIDIPMVSVKRGMHRPRLGNRGQIPVHDLRSIRGEAKPKVFVMAAPEGAKLDGAAEPGDVLLVIDGSDVGVVHLVTKSFVASSKFALIRTAGSELDARYLAQWLAGPEAQARIQRATAGTSMRRVALQEVEDLAVPVPDGEVQKQIGDLHDLLVEINSLGTEISSRLTEITSTAAAAVSAALPQPRESG